MSDTIAIPVKVEKFTGKVEVRPNGKTKPTVSLDGNHGNAWLGGNGHDGDLVLFRAAGDNKSLKQASFHLDGDRGLAWVGGTGAAGKVVLRDDQSRQVVLLDAKEAQLILGQHGQSGGVLVRSGSGKTRIRLNGTNGNVTLGGDGQPGDVWVRNAAGKTTVHVDGGEGNINLGGNGHDGDLSVRNRAGKRTIHLDGDAGDIRLQNADCAEDFDLAPGVEGEPGTVMAIDVDGALRPSSESYQTNVVGVVSGAGDYRPGIVLDRKPSDSCRTPIALMGKVFCKVDAQYGAVRPGDLLTASPSPGHAMKAADTGKSTGAILGKALRSWKEGKGLIPIVVALQ